ncbi:CDG_1a_G0033070.mRNA.1.CDS.1 [Saccharomyces cerevisiae]|nr:Y55_G0004600.mRNA.1.CDS.1 [Saccharomyces cerevisiae]CAI4596025.1 CDG_1a_G0033070.mRNA.1.CDS.1 [Saccharomyces cerevisiae]CAI4614349.1 CBK_G0033450.mRNA.1.CDS.1 [Saccharomyces cerevisiae]CAI7386406.1 CDG_1a_G0033070.mRNA.1.CDS.1 [Saccharomyces cerevisiae]CAI7391761.1 CBK_G0033450.mRNA.1.CDS.1 [Saccharomyces cerevisiae]
MGYVIMTLSSARISERRARIIYIWTHLSAYKINFPFVQFPTFFPSFEELYSSNNTSNQSSSRSRSIVCFSPPYISPLSSQPITLWFSSSFQLLLLDIIL